MAQTVLITLVVAGSDTGPFDLYSDVDAYAVPFEYNIPKASLVAGYLSTSVPNGATIVRAKSKGLCPNFVDLPINGTTYTTTTSTTVIPSTTTSTTTVPSPTTTSTTTTIQYDYYYANVYSCVDCGFGPVQTNFVVAFPQGSIVVINGSRYYLPMSGPDGYAYQPVGAAPAGSALILTAAAWYPDCSAACLA